MTTEERKLELVANLKARCSEPVEYTDEPIEFGEPEMAIEEEQFEMWIEDEEEFAIDLTGF